MFDGPKVRVFTQKSFVFLTITSKTSKINRAIGRSPNIVDIVSGF